MNYKRYAWIMIPVVALLLWGAVSCNSGIRLEGYYVSLCFGEPAVYARWNNEEDKIVCTFPSYREAKNACDELNGLKTAAPQ